MKIGVIGCGDWGANHARTLASFGALGGVADADPERCAALGARYGVPALSGDAMIAAPQIDAVVVALPPRHNAPAALAVLDAGKHLLVEKPMALDLDGAEAIARAARVSGRVAMTGHVLRFHPAFTALAALVAQGRLGRIARLESIRAGQGKLFEDTDVLWDLGPHDLSLMMALTGSAPLRARLTTESSVSDHLADTAWLDLDFAGGITAHSHLSRVAEQRERRLIVTGSAGTAVLDELAEAPRRLALHRPGEAAPQHIDTDGPPPLDAELRHFIDCIENGAESLSDVEEGLAVLRVIAGLTDRAPQRAAGPQEREQAGWSAAS